MAGVLFIHGGDRYAREVFSKERRGYWSRALPLALEKHGFLDLEEAGPEALGDWSRVGEASVVLVARLPRGAWNESVLQAIVDMEAQVIVEGPLPTVLEERLRVEGHGLVGFEGAVVGVDKELRGFAAAYGVPLGSALGPVRVTDIARPSELEWRELGSTGLTEEVAAAWEAPAWEVARWSSRDVSIQCDWIARDGSGSRFPCIVRKGGLVGCSFGLFAFIGQRHTIEPFGPGEWRASDRSVGLEALLLGLIDACHRRRGADRARIMPWPKGSRWARVVRHDVNTPVEEAAAEDLLGAHERAGSKATFYCAPSLRGELTSFTGRVSGSGHEVALNAERLWAAAPGEERRALEEISGTPVRGAAARGSAHCFRHQGAPNILWAEREGLLHSELTGRAHLHPHRFAALAADGTIRALEVICLPQYESLAGVVAKEGGVAAAASSWEAAGGLWQLVADARDPAGLEALEATPATGRLDVTAAQVAEWWRSTHVHGRCRLTSLDGRRLEIAAREPVSELVVEVLRPDGERIEWSVDVEGAPVVIDLATPPPVDETPEAIRARYARALRSEVTARGLGLPPAGVDQHMSECARRAHDAVSVMSDSIRAGAFDSVVLDLSGDLAGTAASLATEMPGAIVICSERSRDRIRAARKAISRAGLADRVLVVSRVGGRVTVVGDAEALTVVIAGDGADAGQAVFEEARRAVRTGGRVIVVLDGGQARVVASFLERVGLRLRPPSAESQASHILVAERPDALAPRAGSPRPRPAAAARIDHDDWQALSEVFAGRLRAYYAARGKDPPDRAAEVTIRTNTTLVPSRGDTLLDCLDELVGLPGLAGLRVLEVGCGFGALATYLLWRERPATLVAVDIDDETLGLARDCAHEVGLEPVLSFRRGDMRDLTALHEDPFDVVLVNNAFIYLTSTADMRTALSEFARSMRPGGALLFYHANRWRWREPFTGAPIVHLLPAPVARAVSRLTGWQHNHGRVKLVGPGALARLLSRQGFDPMGVRAFGGASDRRLLGTSLGTFYALGAWRRPDHGGRAG